LSELEKVGGHRYPPRSFMGTNLKHIVKHLSSEGFDMKPKGLYYFLLHKNHMYYMSKVLMKRVTNIFRECSVSLGTYISKFIKNIEFQITIQSLNLLVTHIKHKIWLKPTIEMYFSMETMTSRAH